MQSHNSVHIEGNYVICRLVTCDFFYMVLNIFSVHLVTQILLTN